MNLPLARVLERLPSGATPVAHYLGQVPTGLSRAFSAADMKNILGKMPYTGLAIGQRALAAATEFTRWGVLCTACAVWAMPAFSSRHPIKN